MNADELERHAKSARLWAKLGLSAEVKNHNLPAYASILEVAAKGMELAAEIKRESRYPSRWVAFYLGVVLGAAIGSHVFFGG